MTEQQLEERLKGRRFTERMRLALYHALVLNQSVRSVAGQLGTSNQAIYQAIASLERDPVQDRQKVIRIGRKRKEELLNRGIPKTFSEVTLHLSPKDEKVCRKIESSGLLKVWQKII